LHAAKVESVKTMVREAKVHERDKAVLNGRYSISHFFQSYSDGFHGRFVGSTSHGIPIQKGAASKKGGTKFFSWIKILS
jgi:hypothetical protein